MSIAAVEEQLVDMQQQFSTLTVANTDLIAFLCFQARQTFLYFFLLHQQEEKMRTSSAKEEADKSSTSNAERYFSAKRKLAEAEDEVSRAEQVAFFWS